jgi:hypothetical protein
LKRHQPGTAPERQRQWPVCLAARAPLHDLTGISVALPALFSQRSIQVPSIERMVAMSRLTKAIRSRRDIARTHRELNRAIANASTPAMRDELIMVAQRAGNVG